MHAVSLRDAGERRRDATFHATFPPAPEAAPDTATPIDPDSRFDTRRRPNIGAIGAVALVHAGLFAALIQMNVIPIKAVKREPLVVELIVEPPAPPPAPPETKVEPVKPIEPVVVAPTPIVRTIAPPPPPVVATATPPPPQSAVVAANATPAPPAGPVSAGDLSSTMIEFKAPAYPVESRRKKEQGIVLLNLLLGLDGRVSEIAVQKSSGFARLDEAALKAVRRWRWSPLMRGGQPMMVRGVVEIPFIIKN
ncbi:outer membrane transport energization protein TonB [Sphingomonas laterariae]|uniref:Outer membrane transport energization protein TonB n=1 Tax=Edaphosphingomonas laterariae TaxID=861865 RepID=A0A239FJR9_9SPHN|nr:energy transducer TonB [Sphingomonas laterariae]SNS56798.1 outer membrane transport energization protein TonB [Sphingomonas laterariae]